MNSTEYDNMPAPGTSFYLDIGLAIYVQSTCGAGKQRLHYSVMRMRLHTVRLNHSANQNRKNNQLLLRNRLGEQLAVDESC